MSISEDSQGRKRSTLYRSFEGSSLLNFKAAGENDKLIRKMGIADGQERQISHVNNRVDIES